MAARGPLLVRVLSIAGAIGGATLVLAVPVGAQEPPPDPGSAVDQYVEHVPSASGPATPGIKKKKRTPLPRAGAKALKKVPPATAKALTDIATSSDYGAPQVSSEPKPKSKSKPKPKPKPVRGGATSGSDAVTTTSVSTTLRSSVGALGTASDTRLVGLLGVLLVSVLAAVALAARRP
jgi:hypothetical protein